MTIKYYLWERLKSAALTMIFLAEQVFCCWQEHLHQLRDFADDVNRTQCCLRAKSSCQNRSHIQSSTSNWTWRPRTAVKECEIPFSSDRSLTFWGVSPLLQLSHGTFQMSPCSPGCTRLVLAHTVYCGSSHCREKIRWGCTAMHTII